MRRRLRYGLSALAGVALAAGAVATTATAHDNPASDSIQSFTAALTQVAGSVPGFAIAQNAVGTLSPAEQLPIQVALPFRDPAGAEQLAAAVSDPASPQYRHYLSAAEFNQRFAPTQQTVDKVTNWLRSQGLTVTGVATGNRVLVDAVGSVGSIQSAFNTTLQLYRVGSQTLRAPATAVQVPTALAGDITSVMGLADYSHAHTSFAKPQLARVPTTQTGPGSTQVQRTAPGQSPSPSSQATGCADYFGQYDDNPHKKAGQETAWLCGYTPNQIKTTYGVGVNPAAGSGQTVAIVDAYDYGGARSDATRYFNSHGLPGISGANAGLYQHRSPGTTSTPSGCEGPSTWRSEQMIDVESVHTLAPRAKIYYYGTKDCNHLFDGINAVVSQKKASIVSNSWDFAGDNVDPATVKAANNIFIQAAAEGIGIYFSSGDNGDNAAGKSASQAQPNFPADSPWVTAVGGTSLGVGATGTRTFETGWESQYQVYKNGAWQVYNSSSTPNGFPQRGGAGGGVSRLFSAPSWQKSVVPSSYAHGKRAVPDVAALADPTTGMLIGFNDGSGFSQSPFGGTSMACPLVAAIVADAQQVQGNSHFGLLTPALYKAGPGSAQIFDVRHVTSDEFFGNSNLGGQTLVANDIKTSTLQSHGGWDNVTGVGVPRGAAFLTGIGK